MIGPARRRHSEPPRQTPEEDGVVFLLDEILDLKSQGLRSVVMLPLGYRKADEDWLVNLKKVRRAKDHFIRWIK